MAGTLTAYVLRTSSPVAGSRMVKLKFVDSPMTEAGGTPHPLCFLATEVLSNETIEIMNRV